MNSRKYRIQQRQKEALFRLWKDIIIPLLAIFVPLLIAILSACL